VLAVFDVDGVVADVRHRVHHLDYPRSWTAFFGGAADDPLLAEGARLVADLGSQHEVVWLTGRPEWLRSVTEDWFAEHGLPGGELFMRPNHDHRPARLFKLSVLRKLAPRGIAAVIDDDPDVIDTISDAGFPAVLADWVARDDTLRDAQERWGRT